MNNYGLTADELEAVLSFFMFRLSMEHRRKLMTMYPTAYAKLAGWDGVEVAVTFRKSDGEVVEVKGVRDA